MNRLRSIIAVAVVAAFISGPALPEASAATTTSASPTALFAAETDYWSGFEEFWTGGLKRTSGVVLTVLGVGVVSMFIITRSKWKK